MLKGKRLFFYEPTIFPWSAPIKTTQVKEQAHFVLSETDLREGFLSVGDLRPNHMSEAKLTLICFIAEAVHYSQKYRGRHAGSTHVGLEPRCIVVLNYLTAEVFMNEARAKPRNREQLYVLENLRGLLISVFICDEDLSFADMCSDMYTINACGLPQYKQRSEFAEIEIDDGGANDNAGNNNGAGANNNNGAAAAAPGQPRVAPRPDKPNHLLGVKGSRYIFSGGPLQWQSHRDTYRKVDDKSFLQINNLNPLVLLIKTWMKDFGFVPNQASGSHMSDMGSDNRYQIRNAFTFEHALTEMRAMNVHGIFKQRENWFNTWRNGANGQETFGAPAWRAGEAIPDMNGVLQRPFEAGSLETALLMPADLFRAQRIQDTLLPHFVPDDMLPASGRSIINVPQGTVNVKQLLESVGIMSTYERQQKEKNEEMNRDTFNELFERISAEQSRLLVLLGDPMNPSSNYLGAMKSLREKGRQLYLSLSSQVASKDIPEGFRFLLTWKLNQPENLAPLPEHMWQTFDGGLTSYGQMKHRMLLITESVIRTSDTQLFLFPVIWRAALSTYMPKVGNTLNKEHIQIICAPGTSKSDLLNRVTDLLIPDTYEIEGGASGMGLVGEHCSQRLIDISHELDNYYAPVEEPKGENAKIHKMILGCLSEGKKKYKTTVEAIDTRTGEKTRAASRKESEDTNVRIGARNYNTFVAKSGGSAAAMYDRFTQVMQVQIYSPRRVSIFSQVLASGPSTETAAKLQVQQQFRMAQDLVGRYCMAVECGWLPFPEMSLFSDLAPMMTSFMAARYPHFHSMLRRVGGMKTRILGDLIWDRACKVLFTPLNPTQKTRRFNAQEMEARALDAQVESKDFDDTPWYMELGPYEPEKLLPEMAKMMYCQYEPLFFVMTERLQEMTNPSMVRVMRHMAELSSQYFIFGRKSVDRKPQKTRWPTEYSGNSPVQLTLDGLITQLLQRRTKPDGTIEENAIYKMCVPATDTQVNFQSKSRPDANGGVDVGYNELELIRERVALECEELYETSAVNRAEPIRLKREISPRYKFEKINGEEFINMNYVQVNSTIYGYAQKMSGNFGELKLDKEGFIQMMEMAALEYMVTPTLPLIPKNSPFDTPEGKGLIQSLRYIPGAMRHFPKYRLPALIKDSRKGCFYLLVSYFETNFHRMCEEMIEYVSYAATPHREILLGIPSEGNQFYYQPYTMRPRPGKKLTIGSKTNVRSETARVLRSYRYDPRTGISTNTGHATFRSKVYENKCIEEERAAEYLMRNFSNEDPDILLNYMPEAIERRLRQYYIENPEGLVHETYRQLASTDAVAEPLLEEMDRVDQGALAPAFDQALRERRAAALQALNEAGGFAEEEDSRTLISSTAFGEPPLKQRRAAYGDQFLADGGSHKAQPVPAVMPTELMNF